MKPYTVRTPHGASSCPLCGMHPGATRYPGNEIVKPYLEIGCCNVSFTGNSKEAVEAWNNYAQDALRFVSMQVVNGSQNGNS